MVTRRSPATSGNSPMITNSVVPMPKEASAKASKGRRPAEALAGAAASMGWNLRRGAAGRRSRHTYAAAQHDGYEIGAGVALENGMRGGALPQPPVSRARTLKQGSDQQAGEDRDGTQHEQRQLDDEGGEQPGGQARERLG